MHAYLPLPKRSTAFRIGYGQGRVNFTVMVEDKVVNPDFSGILKKKRKN